MQELRMTGIRLYEEPLTVDMRWVRGEESRGKQRLNYESYSQQLQFVAEENISLPLDSLAYEIAESMLGLLNAEEVEITVRQDGSEWYASVEGHAICTIEQFSDAGLKPAGDYSYTTAFPRDDYEINLAAVAEHDSGQALPVDTITHTAIVTMESSAPGADDLLRQCIVALDSVPGNQVDGISPLYHVSNVDHDDSVTAVLSVSTRMTVDQLASVLDSISAAHEGYVKLGIVAMEGADKGASALMDEDAVKRAAFLSPWMDMDPQATYHGDPLAYLLISADDAPHVGMLSDRWVFGGAQ